MKHHDQDSGFKWGCFEIHDRKELGGRRPLQIRQRGGVVHYPYTTGVTKHSQHVSQVDQSRPLIHKGNHFQAFTHTRDYLPDTEWYFWDNSAIPQLMEPEVSGSQGKSWCRIIRGSTQPGWVWATESQLTEHERRVNQDLAMISDDRIRDWHDVIKISTRPTQGTEILLVMPSEAALWHWYGVQPQELIDRCDSVCVRWGLRLTVRPKPSRPQRYLKGHSLREQITQDTRAVVCVNSCAAIEALCAGVPVVALGYHNIDSLATPWQHFEMNWWCPPEPLWVEQRLRHLLTVCWLKRDLLEGTWSLGQTPHTAQPYRGLWE